MLNLLRAPVFLSVVLFLFSGCAETPSIQYQNDEEFQEKLHKDPRYEELIRQINFPRDDRWHVKPVLAVVQNRRTLERGWVIELTARTTW